MSHETHDPQVQLSQPAKAASPVLEINSQPPSEQMTAHVRTEFSVVDALGRRITLRKPNVLAQFKLVKMMGESAKNSAYMAMISPLTYVTAIDGDMVGLPVSERELEALIQRLDEAGFMAVVEGIQEHFGEKEENQETALKNS